ncbi:MAG: hypothetical protein ACKOE7_10920, partial [Actinomycetota bacterium]
GLPPGGGLDVRIFGDAAYDYGRLEIVQYEGVQSKDLYPRAACQAARLVMRLMRADGGEIATGAGAVSLDPLTLDIDAVLRPQRSIYHGIV